MNAGTLQTWHEWQQQRTSFLQRPYGWLSVTSFTWLKLEPMELPDFPGSWVVEPEGDGTYRVRATFAPGTVEYAGKPVTEAFFFCENEEDDLSLRTVGPEGEAKIAEVGVRGGKYRVRVRDPHAPALAEFTSVPVFDYDESARIPAYFRPFSHVRKVGIDTCYEGVSGVAELVGVIEFLYKGVENSLAVQGNPEGTLTAVFRDGTNWKETAGWRFVNFPGPDSPENQNQSFNFEISATDVEDIYRESTGNREIDPEKLASLANVVVDFNMSQNFMMAFSDYATCPKPPEGNTISARVFAGEKKYR